jgi:proline iminopeptidase
VRVAEGFHLDVGDGHQVWFETQGSPEGKPAVFLHGGPGSGCNPYQHALFDPAIHYAVFVDQRGAGRSLPHGKRHANTTAHLVEDLERVRHHLQIERWLVVGGSWGATLALAYAMAHPFCVTGIVLRATFLGTATELEWAFEVALPAFHPDLHAQLKALAPDGLSALWQRILDPDPAIHAPAARAFGAAAQDELMRRAPSLAGIPGIIVQARLDLLCPPITSSNLVAEWPDARLVMVEEAGHSLSHPAVFEAVRDGITELMSDQENP